MAKNRFEILRDGGDLQEEPQDTLTGEEEQPAPDGEGGESEGNVEVGGEGKETPPPEEWVYDSPTSRYRTLEEMKTGVAVKDNYIEQLKAEKQRLEDKILGSTVLPPPPVKEPEGEIPDLDLDPQGYVKYQERIIGALEKRLDGLTASQEELSRNIIYKLQEDAFLNSPKGKEYVRGSTLETSNQAFRELLQTVRDKIGIINGYYPPDCLYTAHLIRTAQQQEKRLREAVSAGRKEGAARVAKEIAGSQRGPNTMPATGGQRTTGLTPEQAAEMSPEQLAKLSPEKLQRLADGKTV